MNHTLNPTDLTTLFAPIFQTIMQHAPADKQIEAIQITRAIQDEVTKGQAHHDNRLGKLIDDLAELIPPAVSPVVNVFASPALHSLVGSVTRFVLEKLQNKYKQI